MQGLGATGTDGADPGAVGTVELFCSPTPELFAIVSAERVEVGSFHAPPLRLEGQLARALGDDLGRGSLSAVTEARLRAAAAALGFEIAPLLDTLAHGGFRRASPAEIVRRGGWSILWVELLSGCNLRCAHCYAESEPTRGERLDLPTTVSLLDDAAELGFRTVQFTGGDPLLSPFLLSAIDAARARGLEVEVFTNGLLLRPALLQALRERDVGLAFSLYADRPREHDAVTGVSGSFDLTVDAIRRSRAGGVPSRIAVAVMDQNRSRTLETLRLARELTGDREAVRLDVVREVGRGRFDPGLALPAEAGELSAPGMDSSPHGARGSGRACVTAAGDVVPCIFLRWARLGRVGVDGRLRDILTAPRVCTDWVFAPADALEAAAAERLTCGDCQRAARLLALYAEREASTRCTRDVAPT